MAKARTRIATLTVLGGVLAGGVALVGTGRDHGHGTVFATLTAPAPRAPLSGPQVSFDPRRPAPASGAECGAGFVPAATSLCRPIDSSGRPYSDEELAHADEMRQSPFVAKANFLVPRLMTSAEVAEQRATFVRENALADRVTAGSATEAEIEEYFQFRGRQTDYRLQVLAYQHATSGGRINWHDPVLEAEAITDPELRKRYAAAISERDADDRKHALARERIGLAGHVYAALRP